MKYTFKKVDWFGEDLHTLYGHDNEGFIYGFYTYSDEDDFPMETSWYKSEEVRDDAMQEEIDYQILEGL